MPALVAKIKFAVKDMLDNILMIYAEKGITPFKRPLMIAVPSLLGLYALVYSPVSNNFQLAASSEKNMKVVAQFAGDYENAKVRMSGYQRKLPLIKDKDEWLNYLLTSSAKSAGVSVESLSAQEENAIGNYLVVSRDVSASTTYANFGKWLAEIENSRIFLRITKMSLEREKNGLGTVKVSFTLSTVFPKQAGG
ncbi:MAG: hypothetical protein AUJ51_08825 [Elusimicrobia bacterium CG1_02_56_21]|nr:MAG: hypothetical protein AUJ51_08825 [Elusimicrobia bacterium CG1_02_56_21]